MFFSDSAVKSAGVSFQRLKQEKTISLYVFPQAIIFNTFKLPIDNLNLERLTVRLRLTVIYFPIFLQARPDSFRVCLQLIRSYQVPVLFIHSLYSVRCEFLNRALSTEIVKKFLYILIFLKFDMSVGPFSLSIDNAVSTVIRSATSCNFRAI